MDVVKALVGGRIDRTSFDHQVRLRVVPPREDPKPRADAELVLDTTFQLRDASREWHELEPVTGACLAPVLDLFGQSITAVDARESGSLTVVFDGGSMLWLTPDTKSGSWHVTGGGTMSAGT